jgi:hypothetical protein
LSLPLGRDGGGGKRDRWYFFVTCASCAKPIMFLKAPSPEQDENPAVRGATLTCPHCGAEHSYLASQVQRAQVKDSDA